MKNRFFYLFRRSASLLLTLVFLLSCCYALLACGGKEENEFHKDDYSLPKATSYEDDCSAFPRPEKSTQKTVYYIDITACDYTDLFMSVTLQGLVNRDAPELYLIHDYVVQAASATFNSAQYWFDALDKSYFEEDGVTPYFNKVEIESVLEMILRYYDYIDGVVLYHERLIIRNVTASQTSGANIYGDMAVLNLTSMMCSQKNALPMTEKVLTRVNEYLAENGKEALEVVGDTREFMAKTDDVFDADTGSLEVWYKCYRYALDQAKEGEWEFNTKCLAHNGTFNAANFDYSTAHKIFNYNRIYEGSNTPTITTEKIEALESEIMNLTEDNTPVVGVFHLAGDEEAYVRYQNNCGKYNVVTHETWNLSWTCGLERETAQEKSVEMTYDDSKIYVAITYSESDNNSYCHFKLPLVYENADRGKFNMTWAISASCVDLNPNVIKYMNATMTEGDGYATGESGVGYVRNENVLEEYKAGFFGISDVYAKYLNGSIRTLLNRLPQSLDYVTYMKNLTSVLSGYSGISQEGTYEYNSDKANYYFQDTPIFQNFCCSTADDVSDMLKNVHAQGGTFYSIGMYGWAGNLTALYNVVKSLPENIVFVSQSQLADLYCQKMSAIYNDITEADFDTFGNNEEISYLWYSNNYENLQEKTDIEGMEAYRFGSNEDFVIYRYDLDSSVTRAKFIFDMWGEYKIEASEDLINWTTVATQEYTEYSQSRHQVKFNLPEKLAGKAVYIKISDITEEDGTGYRIYRSNMQTNLSAFSKATFDTRYDNAYLVESAKTDSDGYRVGETVYKFPLNSSAAAINIAVEADSDVALSISADGKNFYKRTMQKYDRSAYAGYGNYYYATLTDVASEMFVKFVTEGALKQVHFNEINTVSTFDFSPVGCDFDTANQALGWDASKKSVGLSSMCKIGNTTVLQYAFILDAENTTPLLEIFAGGMFKLEISVDGSNWATLKSVELGENITSYLVFDISSYAKPGNIFYLRVSKSVEMSGTVSLYYFKLFESV